MPYMELRSYRDSSDNITTEQRDSIMKLVRDHLARGQGIDGTFEFRFLPRVTALDWCEYEYILVIDMGFSPERDAQKRQLATAIGDELVSILGTSSLAVRLRLQNAGFVPHEG